MIIGPTGPILLIRGPTGVVEALTALYEGGLHGFLHRLEGSLTSTSTVTALSAVSYSPATGAIETFSVCLPSVAPVVFQLKVTSVVS